MVIWIGLDPDIVERLQNETTKIVEATSQILFSFYRSTSPTTCWASLVEALTQLNKYNAVKELGLNELQSKTARQSGIQCQGHTFMLCMDAPLCN